MRILVVDDEPAVRDAVDRALRVEGYEVALAGDGREALDAVAGEPPDAMVLDVLMPRLDGLEVCRRLRAAGDRTPVLVLTARDGVADRVGGLDAGADDYLTKPFASTELLARLRAITRVHATGEPVLMVGDWEFRPAARIINSPYSGRIVLSRTEAELLHLLAQHPDETLSRERILREVFPPGDVPGTVDTYVHYLRRKTERDIVTTVRGLGYRVGRP
jgi:DNA-binding response OmpR family regulator